MTGIYRTEDVKLISSVKPLPYLRNGEDIDKTKMSDIFFQSIHQNNVLGIVEAERSSIVSQVRRTVNIRNTDEFEFIRLLDWEKQYSKIYLKDQWLAAQQEHPFIDAVAKIFWLCDHVRNNGTIDFPVTQAWNRYYNTWEVVVGNARIAPLRLFCKTDSLPVIQFKTEFCRLDIQWVKTFDSLNSIEEYFGHAAVINYRAWAGSLIPGVHFYNKNIYADNKLQYQNKLAAYCKVNNGLQLDEGKSLYWNINKILDGIDALD